MYKKYIEHDSRGFSNGRRNPAIADLLASERMFEKVWTTPTAKYVRLF